MDVIEESIQGVDVVDAATSPPHAARPLTADDEIDRRGQSLAKGGQLAIRLDTAQAAIIVSEVDEILAVGAVVARRLYGRRCPVIVLGSAALETIVDGTPIRVGEGGMLVAG